MKLHFRSLVSIALSAALLLGCVGCGGAPKAATTITVWAYYSGDQLTSFNKLVDEFNSTVGQEKHIAFSVSSGYLPVTHAAASLDAIRSSGLELSDSITTVLGLSLNAVENDHLYTTHAFPEGSTARNKLQSAMEDAAEADRATVEERIAAGQTPEEAEAEFLTDDYFDQWYETTRTTLEAFAG